MPAARYTLLRGIGRGTRREAGAVPAGGGRQRRGQGGGSERDEAGLDRITGVRRKILADRRDGGVTSPKASTSSWTPGSRRKRVCDWPQKLARLRGYFLVFDEFAGRVLEAKHATGALTFKTSEGPSVMQLPSAPTVAKSILARTAEGLRLQLTQRELDRQFGICFPHRAWGLGRFCQGGKWDATVRTGKGSLAVGGGTYTATMPQWKYFNRQGAVQFVSLSQTASQPIVVAPLSKAEEVATSEEVVLDILLLRGRHFDAREGHAYCMHLDPDHQDGQWPEGGARCSSRQAPTTGKRRASAWSPPAR